VTGEATVSNGVTPKQVEALGRRHLMLFAGRASRELAGEVARHLGIECGSVDIRDFANGETYARFGESVRGTDAFVIQTHSSPVNERIMEQLIMIDALKRASAKRISAVIPYYGYSRQDKKGRSREPITAKLVADMFKVAGADRLITVDLHSGQVQGFFDGPVDHLTARPLLADHIRAHHERDLVVVAPDAGRVKTAEKMAGVLGCPLAFLHKRRSRDEAERVEVREVVGEVAGLHCVLIDDEIATASTIVQGAEALMANGAYRVTAAATHGVFSGPAIDRLKNAPIAEIVVTNTIPVPEEKRLDKIVVLSIAGILAGAIRAVFEDASVSEIFNDENQF
jgi:ribose-phosphate pyrophosphokinase